jgi:hypothetical protein
VIDTYLTFHAMNKMVEDDHMSHILEQGLSPSTDSTQPTPMKSGDHRRLKNPQLLRNGNSETWFERDNRRALTSKQMLEYNSDEDDAKQKGPYSWLFGIRW